MPTPDLHSSRADAAQRHEALPHLADSGLDAVERAALWREVMELGRGERRCLPTSEQFALLWAAYCWERDRADRATTLAATFKAAADERRVVFERGTW